MDIKKTNWHKELAPQSAIIVYRGSHAHGTYRPPSEPDSVDDIDLACVTLGSPEMYFGLGRKDTIERMEGQWDIVAHDIRKFIMLLIKGNPNMLSLLWAMPEHYLKVTPAGQRLIGSRDMFSSKATYDSFTGYAKGQLHKMESMVFNGYMGEKRKKLVEKYSYDTKNAAHAVRIYRMGIELLETGRLNVFRPDADELVAIKRGSLKLEQVKDMAAELAVRAEAALKSSALPEAVDREAAEGLLVSILSDHFCLGVSTIEAEPNIGRMR